MTSRPTNPSELGRKDTLAFMRGMVEREMASRPPEARGDGQEVLDVIALAEGNLGSDLKYLLAPVIVYLRGFPIPDVRVRDRMVASGILTPGDIERHLRNLPDLASMIEEVQIPDPALSS